MDRGRCEYVKVIESKRTNKKRFEKFNVFVSVRNKKLTTLVSEGMRRQRDDMARRKWVRRNRSPQK